VELRFGEVEIRRPHDEQDRTLAATVRLRLVDVREVDPPEEAEPLHWRLVTTHEIGDAAKAWQVVAWYQARWIIEQLFRVMKSQGLQLEDSQLATGERLVKLAAATTSAACIDMQLVQERDGRHQLPASTVFTAPEIETLEALSPTLEGSTERQQNLHPVASLAWAAWIIARLGGWNCYYKPPGPITMRRGHGAVPRDSPGPKTRNDAKAGCANPLGRRPGAAEPARRRSCRRQRRSVPLTAAWLPRRCWRMCWSTNMPTICRCIANVARNICDNMLHTGL
jgi:Transposase DDE domain